MLAVIDFPNFDPVAIQLGPFAIRWYALAYIAGLLIAWRYCRWQVGLPPQRITPAAIDDFLLWATLGVVLGGRLGYVLFYKPAFFLAHPQEILFLWQGGMSFHGGLLGVIVAMLVFARRIGVPFFALADVIAAATPIGLILGRIANFINGELYGRPSDLPWAVLFPHANPPVPRHPSQLYEAALEGLLLFVVLHVMVRKGALRRTGLVSGAFLTGYALCRLVAELFRAPDQHLGYLIGGATMGQLLSLPMLLFGLAIVAWSRRRARA
ncbi:MAG TPA: prolipoprotein diacylglyceryl transferase [Kiloniellales bacterium]|nr:prolipoprotein diacylglyceryl transferase [Kiloniellales bacterium]